MNARNETYLRNALDDEVRQLGAMQPGQGRNVALFKAARKLGGLLHYGLEERHIIDALTDASERNGYMAKAGYRQVEKTIENGLRSGASEPRHINTLDAQNEGSQGHSHAPEYVRKYEAQKVFSSARQKEHWSEAGRKLAADLLAHAQWNLWPSWLRKINVTSCLMCGIGYQQQTAWLEPEQLGLSPEFHQDGRKRKIALPAGLMIATRRGGEVVAMTIRTPDSRPEWQVRYWQIRGSQSVPFIAARHEDEHGGPVAIVEGAIDAMSIWQESGDVISCVALTGKGKLAVDDTAAQIIAKADPLFIVPDNDQDRAKLETVRAWRQKWPQAIVMPLPPEVKDANELLTMPNPPFSLAAWTRAALELASRRAAA